MRVAIGLARGLDVVWSAEEPAVVGGRRTTLAARLHVVHLEPHRRAAGAAICQLPLALPLIPVHDLALHPGRDGGRPLHLLLDECLERRGEHLLVGSAGLDVRLSRLGLLEQRQELPRHRDVDPACGGGHWLDQGSDVLPSGHVQFAWANFRKRRLHLLGRLHWPIRFDPGHHRPRRHHRSGLQFRRQFQGLLLGEAVEPGKHRGQVLLRRHRGQNCRGGEAELPFPYRLQHLGESLHEPGCRATVMGRRAGELQTPVEIREEIRVSERAEEPESIEFGESLQKVAQGGELDAEEIDESGVEGPGLEKGGVVHESTVSCEFRTPWNAPGSALARSIGGRSRTTPDAARSRGRSWPTVRGTDGA